MEFIDQFHTISTYIECINYQYNSTKVNTKYLLRGLFTFLIHLILQNRSKGFWQISIWSYDALYLSHITHNICEHRQRKNCLQIQAWYQRHHSIYLLVTVQMQLLIDWFEFAEKTPLRFSISTYMCFK